MKYKGDMKGKFKSGDQVYWNDVDEETSGVYTVVSQETEDEEGMSVYLISNEYSEAEVYEHELTHA